MQTTAPGLDLFTIRAMALFSMLVVSGATMLGWRLNQRAAGLRLFATGLFLIALGAAAGMARLTEGEKLGWQIGSQLGSHASSQLGSQLGSHMGAKLGCVLWGGLMFTGMVGMARGVREFRGLAPPRSAVLIPFAAAVSLAFLYWLFGHDDNAMRFGVLSVAYSLLLLDSALSMLRGVPPGQGLIYRPTGIAFACTSAYMAVRAVSEFCGHYGTGLLSLGRIEIGTTICADLAFILCAFGMLLASNIQLRLHAERMALFDPLTGLPNRRLLFDRLLGAEFRALSSGHKFGLIYLDLDGFKQVNDTMGHSVGDDLLRAVSVAMASVLNAGHCLARVGGDEFVVLVENAQSRDPVAALARQLKAAVEARPSPVVEPSGPPMPSVRLSYGLALFPEDGQTAHDIMRLADAAMYRSKRENRPEAPARAESLLRA